MKTLNSIVFLALCAVLYGTGNGDDSKEGNYIFTTALIRPYVWEKKGASGNSRFQGFIPAFLKALQDREAIPSNYEYALINDGHATFGFYDTTLNRWTGMMGQLVVNLPKKVPGADLAAAPMQVTVERDAVADFSTIWSNLSLVIVTRADNGFTSVQDVIDSPYTVGGIDGGTELGAIRKEIKVDKLWTKIDSDPMAPVTSAEEGIKKAREGNYSMIVESNYGDYITSKHCELTTIDVGVDVHGYAFALAKDSTLKTALDKGITAMINDGSLAKLRRKYWDVPCVSGQGITHPSPFAIVALILAAFMQLS